MNKGQAPSNGVKWCFLLNTADLIQEFLGKFCFEAVREGDECIIVSNSKIAEYSKLRFFPEKTPMYSRVEWVTEHYKKSDEEVVDLTWKEFFPSFVRKKEFGNFTYEYSVDIVTQTYIFLDTVFQREQPDAVLGELPANIFSQVAYILCKKYSIRYLGFSGSRMSGRIDIYDKEYTSSKYKETYENIGTISKHEKKTAIDFIEKFLSHEQLPSYEQGKRSISRIHHARSYLIREWGMVRYWLQYIRRRRGYSYDYESELGLQATLRRPLKAWGRFINRLFNRNVFDTPGNDDVYYLFPLHLQPEASTSVLASYFSSQHNSVLNAAFSLPFPYKLYVKAHPSGVWNNKRDFYRELKKIPNVVLLSPEENVANLIKESRGVITLTSTIGLEAALAGKPVYILGNVFYSYHPLCKKVSGFDELRKVLQEDTRHPPKVMNLEEINIHFVTSYSRNTIPGSTRDAGRVQDRNDYKFIYQYIRDHFLHYEIRTSRDSSV